MGLRFESLAGHVNDKISLPVDDIVEACEACLTQTRDIYGMTKIHACEGCKHRLFQFPGTNQEIVLPDHVYNKSCLILHVPQSCLLIVDYKKEGANEITARRLECRIQYAKMFDPYRLEQRGCLPERFGLKMRSIPS
jgi:hypothetical protein